MFLAAGVRLFHSIDPKYPTLLLKASHLGTSTSNNGALCALVLISLTFSSFTLLFLLYMKFSTGADLLFLRRGSLADL